VAVPVEDKELEAKLRSLTPRQQELVREVMQDHPTLTFEEALEMLKSAGM